MLHNIRLGVTQVRQALSDKSFFVLFFGSCGTGCNNSVTCGLGGPWYGLSLGVTSVTSHSQAFIETLKAMELTVTWDKDPVSCIIRPALRHTGVEFWALKRSVCATECWIIGSSKHCQNPYSRTLDPRSLICPCQPKVHCCFSAGISESINIHLNPGYKRGLFVGTFLAENRIAGCFYGPGKRLIQAVDWIQHLML